MLLSYFSKSWYDFCSYLIGPDLSVPNLAEVMPLMLWPWLMILSALKVYWFTKFIWKNFSKSKCLLIRTPCYISIAHSASRVVWIVFLQLLYNNRNQLAMVNYSGLDQKTYESCFSFFSFYENSACHLT